MRLRGDKLESSIYDMIGISGICSISSEFRNADFRLVVIKLSLECRQVIQVILGALPVSMYYNQSEIKIETITRREEVSE